MVARFSFLSKIINVSLIPSHVIIYLTLGDAGEMFFVYPIIIAINIIILSWSAEMDDKGFNQKIYIPFFGVLEKKSEWTKVKSVNKVYPGLYIANFEKNISLPFGLHIVNSKFIKKMVNISL